MSTLIPRPLSVVERYETSDGSLFATRNEAEEHQYILDISEMLTSDTDIYLPSCSPEDITRWFAKHFVLSPKE